MAAEHAREGRSSRQAGSLLATIAEAIMRDGTLAAAGRQGVDEIGMALKAFPDSIQAQEPGTIGNPTQGEIASAREARRESSLPSPSQIAEAKHLGEMGRDRSREAGTFGLEGEGRSRLDEQGGQERDVGRGARGR